MLWNTKHNAIVLFQLCSVLHNTQTRCLLFKLVLFFVNEPFLNLMPAIHLKMFKHATRKSCNVYCNDQKMIC